MSEGPKFGDRLSGLFRGKSGGDLSPGGSGSGGGGGSAVGGMVTTPAGGGKLGPMSPAAAQYIDQLSAQVVAYGSSERNMKEHIEKLEVQKSLLENLIDKIGEGSDEEQASYLKSEVLKLQQESADQQVQLKALKASFEESERKCQEAERTSTAFSSAVENANHELLQSEQECRKLQSEAARCAEATAHAAQLKGELESTHATVGALMAKVSKMDHEKEEMKAEIEQLNEELATATAASALTAPASASATGEDVAAAPPKVSSEKDLQQLQQLTEALEHKKKEESILHDRLNHVTEDLAHHKLAAKEERQMAKAAAQESYNRIQQLEHELESKKKDEFELRNSLNNVTEELANLKIAAKEELQEAKTDHEVMSNRFDALKGETDKELQERHDKIEALVQEIDDLRAESTATVDSLTEGLATRQQELDATKAELATEQEQHNEAETRLQEAVEELESARRSIEDLEASHEEATHEMQQLNEKLEQEETRAESEKRTRLMLKQECERLVGTNEELEIRLADVEGEQQVKMRQKSNLIKDLQHQMVSLEKELEDSKAEARQQKHSADQLAAQLATGGGSSSGGSGRGRHSDPTRNGAAGGGGGGGVSADVMQLTMDNTELIQRVTDLQEKIWMLETTKTSYESELDRITKDLHSKNAIIQAHFSEAAAKYGNKSLGSSLFGPKPADVHAQMQSMLETTLQENMAVQAQLRDTNHSLTKAMEALRVAEAQGFVRIQEDDEEEEYYEEPQDDVFE